MSSYLNSVSINLDSELQDPYNIVISVSLKILIKLPWEFGIYGSKYI